MANPWWVPLVTTGLGLYAADRSAGRAVDAQLQGSSEALDFLRESRDIGLGLSQPFYEASTDALARIRMMTGLDAPLGSSGSTAAAPPSGALDPRFAQNAGDPSGYRYWDPDGQQMMGTSEKAFDPNAPSVNPSSGSAVQPDWLVDDPSYQFRLNEGMRAVENSAFARGGGASGGSIKKALRYAQDYASTEYSNIYNRLASIVGYAQVQPAGAAISGQFGTNAANIALNAGEARASGYVAQGNMWQNAMDQIGMIDWGSIFNR